MKKELTIILLSFSTVATGKTFTEESINDAHKYLIYENLALGIHYPELIGLHCLSAHRNDHLLQLYPILKDPAFSIPKVNKNICEMASYGLLSFENMDKYFSEVKSELKVSH